MSNHPTDTETILFKCPVCKVDIETFWVKEGGYISGNYVFAGELFWHERCWDFQLFMHPPCA